MWPERVSCRYLSALSTIARPVPASFVQTVVDSPALFIGLDEPNRWLYVDLRGPYDGPLAQAACEQMLTSLRQWPCQKILSDGTNVLAVHMQRTQWGGRWLEEMQAAGLRYFAWVLPLSLQARHATEERVQPISNPLVGTFDDIASACLWLQQQREVSEELKVMS